VKTLTKAEEQVMQVLWKLGRGFLKDFIEASPEPKPHANTIGTILKILVEKGFVEYEVKGRNNLYKPRISRSDYGKKSIQILIKGYFEGSVAKVVSQFLVDNKLTAKDMEDLSQLLKSSKSPDLPFP
jgi:BlaI family transcriptional regulator, penicillinase repressor